MHLEEQATKLNPFFAQQIVPRLDFFPKGFTDSETVDIINRIGETRRDYDMLMEAASFDEIDDYYNPGQETVSSEFILEAITVEKFSKTEHRMAAVVRVLNKHLAGTDILALQPVVGKPRKSGKFAYVTVQLPFSDGQVVSVIFHAPEGDKLQIGPNDRIIAFRWLLNKRDITQVVAPEEGAEVSLETIGKRITQLVAKNSARFVSQQKDAADEKKALEEAEEGLKTAQERQVELMTRSGEAAQEMNTIYGQLSSTLAQLEKQRAINAELEAKLDGLKKAAEHKPEVTPKPQREQSKTVPPQPEVPKGKTVNTKNETETPGSAGSGETTVVPPTPTVPTPPEPTPPATPSFVSTMNDILAGKYSDTKQIGALLDAAIDEAEASGTMDVYEELLNQAADYLTGLLKKRSEEV